jgi:hypothetical protein
MSDDDHAMRRDRLRGRGPGWGRRLRELAELIREVECRAGAASSNSMAAVKIGDGADDADESPRGAARLAIRTGWNQLDQLGVLVRGVIHEWFAINSHELPEDRSGQHVSVLPRRAVASGGSLRRSTASCSPPLCILAHLAGAAMNQASDDEACRGRNIAAHIPPPIAPPIAPYVAWIGRKCWPYPRLLIRSRGMDVDHSIDQQGGVEDRSMLERSIFIDPPDDAARLWAIDLALRSGALAAVVADGSKLDMAATRRLQLAAEHGGALALLARPPRELDRLSAASTRWIVRSVPSPGRWPRWSIELCRCKGFLLDAMRAGEAASEAGVSRFAHHAASPNSILRSLPCVLPEVELTDAMRLVADSADVVDRSGASPPASSCRPPMERSRAARRSA